MYMPEPPIVTILVCSTIYDCLSIGAKTHDDSAGGGAEGQARHQDQVDGSFAEDGVREQKFYRYLLFRTHAVQDHAAAAI